MLSKKELQEMLAKPKFRFNAAGIEVIKSHLKLYETIEKMKEEKNEIRRFAGFSKH